MAYSGPPLSRFLPPCPTWALEPCAKLPHTMHMSSSSYLPGSGWLLLPSTHLDALLTLLVGCHPMPVHLLVWVPSLPCSGCPNSLSPPSCTETCFTQSHLMLHKFLILKFIPKCHSERLLPPMWEHPSPRHLPQWSVLAHLQTFAISKSEKLNILL